VLKSLSIADEDVIIPDNYRVADEDEFSDEGVE